MTGYFHLSRRRILCDKIQHSHLIQSDIQSAKIALWSHFYDTLGYMHISIAKYMGCPKNQVLEELNQKYIRRLDTFGKVGIDSCQSNA